MALELDPRANQFLAALPDTELRRWLHELEPVTLALGDVLYEPGAMLEHVYFPTSAIVALLHRVDDDPPAEIALIGAEGVVGVALLMGDQSLPSSARVQCAGAAFRLQGEVLRDGFRRAPMLQRVLQFTQVLVTQMAQTAACNRQHSLEQRMCRWLLMSLDRSTGSELVMTQALIAGMLGMHREDVTETASLLQAEGVVRYAPGRIAVLDREGLALRACACRTIVKREYERLLPARVAV